MLKVDVVLHDVYLCMMPKKSIFHSPLQYRQKSKRVVLDSHILLSYFLEIYKKPILIVCSTRKISPMKKQKKCLKSADKVSLFRCDVKVDALRRYVLFLSFRSFCEFYSHSLLIEHPQFVYLQI